MQAPDADGFVIGRHTAAGRLGKAGREHAERAQQNEKPKTRGLAEGGRDERALFRKFHFDDIEHALVHVDFGGALGRIGQ